MLRFNFTKDHGINRQLFQLSTECHLLFKALRRLISYKSVANKGETIVKFIHL